MPFVECCILSYFIHREPCFLPPYPVVCVDTRRLQRNQTITSPRYADDFRIVIHLLYHAAVPGMSPNVQNMQTGVMLQPIMNPMVSSPLFMVPGQISQQQMQQQPIMATAVAEPLESVPSAPPMMTSKNNIAPPEGIINTSQGMVPASQIVMMQGPNGLIPVMMVASPQGQFVPLQAPSTDQAQPLMIPQATLVPENEV